MKSLECSVVSKFVKFKLNNPSAELNKHVLPFANLNSLSLITIFETLSINSLNLNMLLNPHSNMVLLSLTTSVRATGSPLPFVIVGVPKE